jgi:hypothetical protein
MINMTINKNLKIKIIAQFLSGIKREVIADDNGISTGSVSAIAEEFEEQIPDIHKLRAMMIKLNETGNSPKTFYHAIRLHNHIENLGLSMVQVENILEILQEYVFKNNYNIADLFDAVINAYSIALRCGTDLEHLDEYANARKVVLEGIEIQVRKLRYDREILPYKLNIDLAEFQEYQKHQPIFQKYMQMTMESDIKDSRIKLLEEEKKDLQLKYLEMKRENERLKLRLKQLEKNEGRNYPDYQLDITNLDSTDCLVDDNDRYDVENNNI